MAENVQVTYNKIDGLRKELDSKIEKKVSDTTFWSIMGVIVIVASGIFFWLMNMNEKITRVETKIDMIQSIQASQPVRK